MGELEQQLSATEWAEWWAYLTVEPPDQLADLHHGKLLAHLASLHGVKSPQRPANYMVRKPWTAPLTMAEQIQREIAAFKAAIGDGNSGHGND